MKTIATLFVTASLALFAAPASADNRIDERRPAAADAVVEISNVMGSVQVVGWRRNEVQVEGTLGDGVERLEFDGPPGRIVVRVHLVRNRSRGHDRTAEANLVVRVPQGARVHATTVSAPLRSEGVDGALELRSVSGDVDATGGFRQADLQSVSGTVRLRGTGRDATVKAGSISGLVQVDDAHGVLHGESVSGTVRVTASGLRRAELKSVSGEVVYDAPLAANGVYEVETVSGTARVVVPANASARYDLSTFNGSIRNAFGPRPVRTSEYAPGVALQFEEGQGGAQVRMRSISGTLHLTRR